MNIDIEQERREFEAAYKEKYPSVVGIWHNKFVLDEDGDYADGCVFVAFEMWLAAKRAAVGSAEPVAYMWQHDETGRIGFVELDQMEMDWQRNNPCNKIIGPVFLAPPAPVSATVNGIDEVEWLKTGLRNYQEKLAAVVAEYEAYQKEHPAPVSAEPDFLADEDRLIIGSIRDWLKGAAQADRKNYSRGECAEALNRVLASAPPSTDAKNSGYELPERKLEYVSPLCPDYPSEDSFNEGYIDGWNDCIDAAIAAKGAK